MSDTLRPRYIPVLLAALALLLAAHLTLAEPVLAQNAALSGVVVASDGSGPLAGVNIRVIETGATATSNNQGRFQVQVPAGKSVTLEFSKPGFSTKREGLTRNAAGIIVSLQRS